MNKRIESPCENSVTIANDSKYSTHHNILSSRNSCFMQTLLVIYGKVLNITYPTIHFKLNTQELTDLKTLMN